MDEGAGSDAQLGMQSSSGQHGILMRTLADIEADEFGLLLPAPPKYVRGDRAKHAFELPSLLFVYHTTTAKPSTASYATDT